MTLRAPLCFRRTAFKIIEQCLEPTMPKSMPVIFWYSPCKMTCSLKFQLYPRNISTLFSKSQFFPLYNDPYTKHVKKMVYFKSPGFFSMEKFVSTSQHSRQDNWTFMSYCWMPICIVHHCTPLETIIFISWLKWSYTKCKVSKIISCKLK